MSISGISWCATAGVFMIAVWASVQGLLVLLHLREMDELKMTSAVRIVQHLQADLEKHSQYWIGLFLALHFPIFGYSAYLATVSPWFPATQDAAGSADGLRWFVKMSEFSMSVFAFLGVSSAVLLGLFALPGEMLRKKRWKREMLVPLVYILAWIWLGASIASHIVQVVTGQAKTLFS